MDRETEMQVLLSAQSLNKALQRESLGTTKCQLEAWKMVVFDIRNGAFKVC
jgi:hypothetical protein